jgi:hypothetical protein
VPRLCRLSAAAARQGIINTIPRHLTDQRQHVLLAMKRTRPGDDSLNCSASIAKRHKAHRANFRTFRASPPSNSSSQTSALTKEALESLQQSLRKTTHSTKHETGSYLAVRYMERMPAPPTPRSASSHHSERPRRSARSYAPRTPSPNKKPSPQTYRTRNLHHANVFIDKLSGLPPGVDEQVRQILGIDSWLDQIEPWQDRIASLACGLNFKDTAVGYQADSLRNASDCALEGDWKASLYGLLRKLTAHWAGTLKVHTSEKGMLAA